MISTPEVLIQARAIGKRFQQARKRVGLTVEDAAQAIGVTVSSLYKVEIGNRNLTLERIEEFCHRYGVSRRFIYLGEGPIVTRKKKGPTSDGEQSNEHPPA